MAFTTESLPYTSVAFDDDLSFAFSNSAGPEAWPFHETGLERYEASTDVVNPYSSLLRSSESIEAMETPRSRLQYHSRNELNQILASDGHSHLAPLDSNVEYMVSNGEHRSWPHAPSRREVSPVPSTGLRRSEHTSRSDTSPPIQQQLYGTEVSRSTSSSRRWPSEDFSHAVTAATQDFAIEARASGQGVTYAAASSMIFSAPESDSIGLSSSQSLSSNLAPAGPVVRVARSSWPLLASSQSSLDPTIDYAHLNDGLLRGAGGAASGYIISAADAGQTQASVARARSPLLPGVNRTPSTTSIRSISSHSEVSQAALRTRHGPIRGAQNRRSTRTARGLGRRNRGRNAERVTDEDDSDEEQDRRSGEIFQCTFGGCGKTFQSKTWKRHEETKHMPRHQWTCMATGFMVTRPHVSSATDPTAPSMFRHGSRGQTTACAFCGKPEPNPRTHLQECPHRLADCLSRPEADRTFSRKDHLFQHIRNWHRLPSPSGDFGAEWRARVEYAGQTWGCGFCGERLTSWERRARHLRAHFRDGCRVETDWDEEMARAASTIRI